MFVPVVNALLHAPEQLLQNPEAVPVRRRERERPVGEEALVKRLLDPRLA